MGLGVLLSTSTERLLPGSGRARAGPPFRYPEGRHGNAELRHVDGIPLLTVRGTPEEIGAAVGSLALKPGRRMADYPDDLLRAFWLRPLRWPILQIGRRLARRFPDDYRREMEAMCAAAGLDHDRAVLGNTFYDVKKVAFCSALLVTAARSSTGGPLLGRNLDYPPLGYADEYSLVTVYRPCGARHAFVSVGFPGMVGCLSGMNDAGLTVAVMEAYQVRRGVRRLDLSGLPFALCFRRLLEECSCVEEALAALRRMKRLGLNSLVVADRDGVAVFEITPDRVAVRRPRDGLIVCTNHFCTPELRPPATRNLFNTVDHFTTLEQATRTRARFGSAELHAALHAVSDPDITMQTMVFEPRRLRLHLAIGTVPASAGPLQCVDLAPFLQGTQTARREEARAA
jgi:isopenicillin-N N-acyltransferase-like protein